MPRQLPLARQILKAGGWGLGLGAAAALVLVTAGWIGALAPMTGPVADGAWTARSRAWFTGRGFFATEADAAGVSQTWTSEGIRIVVPYLDRRQAHDLILTVSAGRSGGTPPTLTPSVDGSARAGVPLPNEFIQVAIRIPPAETSRAVVTARVTPTFDPGPHDERMLGVLVREIALVPASGTFTPAPAGALRLTLAVAALAAGVLLLVPGFLGTAVATAAAAFLTWLMLLDGAYLGAFVDDLVHLGLVGLVGGVLVFVASRVRSSPGEAPLWATAVGLLLAGTLVKLALFSHAQIVVGDGIFQVHRAHMVRGGQYFFTSVTPRPFFEFPYAIGLYVTALPFWSWFPRELDQLWLLRVVVLTADALGGLALFALARRVWSSPTALGIAALWPFARAPFEALCNANLTNAFGQAVFAIAMAALGWMAAGSPGALAAGIVGTLLLAAAFLSHFSTLTVGATLVVVVAAALVVGGRGTVRLKGIWIGAACVIAVMIAYGLYYRHFEHVYRQTVDRVMSQETVNTGSSIAASPALKLRRWLTGGSDDYGLPGLPLAAAAVCGAALLWRDRRREPWTLALSGWLAVWVGFTALGILTSVQMRVNLAAAPMFVCLGAYAIGHWSAGGRRWLSAAAAVAVVFDGMRVWLMCIGR